MVVEPSTVAAVLAHVHEPGRIQAAPPGLHQTERQRDVLALLAEGLDPRAIARTLGISVNTSRGHVKSVMTQLGAHSQLEAVIEAIRIGLVDIESPVRSHDPTSGDDRPSGRSPRA